MAVEEVWQMYPTRTDVYEATMYSVGELHLAFHGSRATYLFNSLAIHEPYLLADLPSTDVSLLCQLVAPRVQLCGTITMHPRRC